MKKTPSDKRAVLPRPSDRTKAFVKDWTRLTHSGRFDMKRLKEVMRGPKAAYLMEGIVEESGKRQDLTPTPADS